MNDIGMGNTASGFQCLYSNTGGCSNTAEGWQALYFNSSGYNNTASGFQALRSNTSGINNTAIGFNAGNLSSGPTTGNSNIYIGHDIVPATANESETIRIGSDQTSTFIV